MTEYNLEPVEGDPFAHGYSLEAVDGDPFAKPAAKKDTGFAKGLAYGAENVLRGADATTNQLKSLLGMAKGRSMATALADKLHQAAGLDSYAPAGPDMMDSSKGVLDRLSYAPRAMVEGAPSLVTQLGPGKIGTGMALANNVYQNLGRNLETADASGAGRGGAIAATALDAFLSRFGIDQTIGKGVAKAGVEPAKKLMAGILATGGENAVQTAIDRNLIENKQATADDMLVSGLTGGAVSAGFKGMRGDITDAGEAFRFRQFAENDPKALAAAARWLNDNTGSYGTIKEGNASDVLTRGRSAAGGQLDLTERNNVIGGKSQIVDQLNQAGNLAASRAYVETDRLLKAKEPVPPELLNTLRQELGGNPLNDQWLREVETASILNSLGDIGNKGAGGLHASKLGGTLDRLAGYFGLGTAGGALAGLHTVSPTAAAIGAGTTALGVGIRGVDKLSGYSNPVGRFARRFAEDAPSPSSQAAAPQATPVHPMAAAMSQAAQAPQGGGTGINVAPILAALQNTFQGVGNAVGATVPFAQFAGAKASQAIGNMAGHYAANNPLAEMLAQRRDRQRYQGVIDGLGQIEKPQVGKVAEVWPGAVHPEVYKDLMLARKKADAMTGLGQIQRPPVAPVAEAWPGSVHPEVFNDIMAARRKADAVFGLGQIERPQIVPEAGPFQTEAPQAKMGLVDRFLASDANSRGQPQPPFKQLDQMNEQMTADMVPEDDPMRTRILIDIALREQGARERQDVYDLLMAEQDARRRGIKLDGPKEAPVDPAQMATLEGLMARYRQETAGADTSQAFKDRQAATKAARAARAASADRFRTAPAAPETPVEAPETPVEAPKRTTKLKMPGAPQEQPAPFSAAFAEQPRPQPRAAAPNPQDMVTHKVGRWEFSMPRSELTRGDEMGWKRGIDEKVLVRQKFINGVKDSLPASYHDRAEALLDKFFDKGMGLELAKKAYFDFVDSLSKLSDARKDALKAKWDDTPRIRTQKHWNSA